MINMLITFRHEKWGCIRACRVDGEPWFVAEDVMNSLGYVEAGRHDINTEV